MVCQIVETDTRRIIRGGGTASKLLTPPLCMYSKWPLIVKNLPNRARAGIVYAAPREGNV